MNFFHRIPLVVFCLTLLGSAVARAHDAGLSVVRVQARDHQLELTASYALADVQLMLPPTIRLGTDTSHTTLEDARGPLDQLASLLWEVRANGETLVPEEQWIDFTPSDNLAFHLVYPRPGTGVIEFRSQNLGSLPAAHREHFAWIDEAGRTRVEQLLTAAAPAVSVPLADMNREPVTPPTHPGSVTPPPTFTGFLTLGLEHIWTGYDHLLFLFGLLVVCRTFGSVALIITCFTLAHSLTLALATLAIVQFPARVIEPMIALSIVFVGAENLWRGDAEPRGRWLLTLAFGLVHGFGFASALRDLGVGSDGRGVAWPLFAFNLGVELGQVAVAAVVLPLVWRLRRHEFFLRRGVPALSSLVIAAGLYWLLQRTLLA